MLDALFRSTDAVMFAAAKMTGQEPEQITAETELPQPRAHFLWLVLRRVENPGMCPYTGEANTTGELIKALNVEGSTLKWISE